MSNEMAIGCNKLKLSQQIIACGGVNLFLNCIFKLLFNLRPQFEVNCSDRHRRQEIPDRILCDRPIDLSGKGNSCRTTVSECTEMVES